MANINPARIALEFSNWLARGGRNLNPDDFITFFKRKFPNADLGNVKNYINDFKSMISEPGQIINRSDKAPSPVSQNRLNEINKGLDELYKTGEKEISTTRPNNRVNLKDILKSASKNNIVNKTSNVVKNIIKNPVATASAALRASAPYLIYEGLSQPTATQDEEMAQMQKYIALNQPNVDKNNIKPQDTENYDLTPDAETEQLAQNYRDYMANNQVSPSDYSRNPEVTNLPPLPNTPVSFVDSGNPNRPVQLAQNAGDNSNNMLNNNRNSVSTGAAAPIQYQTYVPVGNYRPTEFENQLSQQVLAPTGQITPQEMKGLLDNYYNQMKQDIAQNPYYGGGYVQPQGYNIDPDRLAYERRLDELRRAGGGRDLNKAQEYLDTQNMLYKAQMANQAGVPYEDYVTGMNERYKQQVLANQQQVEAQLKAYVQQSTDMASKLKYLQEIQKSRLEAQRAIDVANANALGDIQQAATTGQFGLRREDLAGQYGLQREAMQGQTQREVQQMKDIAEATRLQAQLNDPNAALRATGQFLGNASWFMQQPQMLANIVNALSPQQQIQIFGKQLNPQDINDIFMVQQAAQQNPGWFAQLIQRYQPNVRGANEQ